MHGTLKVKRKNLSAVSSNRRLFADAINRLDNAHSRRWTDIYNQCIHDLGGDDAITAAQRSLIRRIATMQCVLEQREADYVKTGTQSRDQASEYQSLSRSHMIMMKRVGLIGGSVKPTETDEDDDIDPLTYARSHRRRSRLNDDEGDD